MAHEPNAPFYPWPLKVSRTAQGTAIPRGFFGINPTAPGYTAFTVKPQPGTVTEAQIAVPTHAGLIKASFVQDNGQSFVLQLAPPANTMARVCLPKLGKASASLVVDGVATAGTVENDYVCVDKIGSAAAGKLRTISRA